MERPGDAIGGVPRLGQLRYRLGRDSVIGREAVVQEVSRQDIDGVGRVHGGGIGRHGLDDADAQLADVFGDVGLVGAGLTSAVGAAARDEDAADQHRHDHPDSAHIAVSARSVSASNNCPSCPGRG